MALRSGLAHQLGWSAETTYGTYVAPSKFSPATGADLTKVKNTVTGEGLAAGQFIQSGARRKTTTVGGTGSIEMDVPNKGIGLLIQALMGTTITPVIQGAGPGYLQTHTMADPFGKSLTLQSGIPESSTGTVKPYTFLGVKVLGAEFKFVPGELVTVTFDIDAREVVESETLVAASYPASQGVFPGVGVAVKIGTYASEAAVSGIGSVTVKFERPSKDDRYHLGAAGKKAEPILNEMVPVGGTISSEYYDKAILADRFAADTSFSLVTEAIGPALGSFFETFRIVLPQCFLDGDTPTPDGADVVAGDYPFTCLFDGTNLPRIEIISTDVTI